MLSREVITQRLKKLAQSAELFGKHPATSKADRVWCAQVIAGVRSLCDGDVDGCGPPRVAGRDARPGEAHGLAAPVSGAGVRADV